MNYILRKNFFQNKFSLPLLKSVLFRERQNFQSYPRESTRVVLQRKTRYVDDDPLREKTRSRTTAENYRSDLVGKQKRTGNYEPVVSAPRRSIASQALRIDKRIYGSVAKTPLSCCDCELIGQQKEIPFPLSLCYVSFLGLKINLELSFFFFFLLSRYNFYSNNTLYTECLIRLRSI